MLHIKKICNRHVALNGSVVGAETATIIIMDTETILKSELTYTPTTSTLSGRYERLLDSNTADNQ